MNENLFDKAVVEKKNQYAKEKMALQTAITENRLLDETTINNYVNVHLYGMAKDRLTYHEVNEYEYEFLKKAWFYYKMSDQVHSKFNVPLMTMLDEFRREYGDMLLDDLEQEMKKNADAFYECQTLFDTLIEDKHQYCYLSVISNKPGQPSVRILKIHGKYVFSPFHLPTKNVRKIEDVVAREGMCSNIVIVCYYSE